MQNLKLLSAFGMICALQFTHAGSITDIKISKINNEEQVLQVTFDGPAPVANSFATANPPRVAFDFSDTSVKLANSQVALDNPLVRSATAVATGSRARLVLNLNRNASYSSEASGNTLQIRLSSNPEATAQNATPVARVSASQIAAPQTYQNSSNTRIDFRRGSNGEGRIEINLPASNVPVDVRREGKNLVADLVGVQLPRSQERKLDVNDFGTPVSKIDAWNKGKNGHIVIQPSGAWDFSSYQTDNKLIIEVKRPTAAQVASTGGGNGQLAGGGINLGAGKRGDPLGLNANKVYKGEKLSLNFQNIEIRTVLQVIAEFTKLNIVTSDSVTGNITLRLQDVPWDQALDLILETKGLGQRRQGNVIRIAPNSELLADDTAKLEAYQKLQGLEPIESETFQLRYKKVEEFKEVLDSSKNSGSGKNSDASLLSDRGSALIDPRNNILIINDTRSVIEKIRNLVDQLDTPLKQVLIEARVVEANDNFARDLGVKLGFMKNGGDTSVGSDFNNVIDNYRESRTQGGEVTIGPNVNLPAAAATSSIAVLTKLAGGFIDLELTAMQKEERGKVISSPRLLTADRMEASIKEGQEIPYQEATSSGATSTTFKEAVLGMNVKPQITPDGNIIMDVKITKNSVVENGNGAMTVREVNTQVMVENGGTVVIGGIYVQEDSETSARVPYLSNIPVLGALFRENAKSNRRRELLVFLTPRLVDSASMLQTRY